MNVTLSWLGEVQDGRARLREFNLYRELVGQLFALADSHFPSC